MSAVNSLTTVYLVDAVRTPIGRCNGALARISATGASASDPLCFGLTPVEAVERASAKAGTRFDGPSVPELNEVFAAQILGCLTEWPEFDPALLNPPGRRHRRRPPARPPQLRHRPGHPLHRRGPGPRPRSRTLTPRTSHDSQPS